MDLDPAAGQVEIMRIESLRIGEAALAGKEAPVSIEPLFGKTFTAIDLYSGVGGWSLGFKLAGIQTVASYELSKAACETQESNLGVKVIQTDIRQPLPSLPEKIDIVVGSPPCTEFSFSNRGGGGDISDGLKDLERFLSIVQKLSPRYWVFENVPRVESILREHVYTSKGKLRKFRVLFEKQGATIRVLDMSHFGLPQRRMRCIVGKYPVELLESYAKGIQPMALSTVISALRGKEIQDPLYSIKLSSDELTEHEYEPVLTSEERRLNRDAKCVHPIYNRMEFPDNLDRPVRAITATCTRVSRESIIVPSDESKRDLRRLTLRERASLQGFPINFQFHARSRSKKMEMIGNAIPPLFTYFIGCAMLGKAAREIIRPYQLSFSPAQPAKCAPHTTPTPLRSSYLISRRFRGTEPFLHFKSGVRFELANNFNKGLVRWNIRFYFGSSSDIRIVEPSARELRSLKAFARRHKVLRRIEVELDRIATLAQSTSGANMQLRWSRRGRGTSPHTMMRLVSVTAKRLSSVLSVLPTHDLTALLRRIVLKPELKKRSKKLDDVNKRKFEQNVCSVVAGLYCAALFNASEMSKPTKLDDVRQGRKK